MRPTKTDQIVQMPRGAFSHFDGHLFTEFAHVTANKSLYLLDDLRIYQNDYMFLLKNKRKSEILWLT